MKGNTLAFLLASAIMLAGCADDGADDPDSAAHAPIDATATAGGIRGVVVDEAIRPLHGATVVVLGQDLAATTDEVGHFSFSGLPGGQYFVQATHPLYDTVQQAVTVEAGVREPPLARFQLTRVIEADPYMVLEKYEGFITCSLNLVVVLSEECGEGVGVPGMGRIGGNENNQAQIDFRVDGSSIRTLIVEQVWTPSTSVGTGAQSGGFYTVIATDWSCDPVCSGSRMGSADGESPLRIAIEEATLAQQELTADTVVSSFTWASTEETGVLLEQEFELFVSAFYHLPAPEGWSYVAGDDSPY